MWYVALKCESEADLQAVTEALSKQDLPFEIRQNHGLFELYVQSQALALNIEQFQFQRLQDKKYALSIKGLKSTPITTVILLLCLATGLLTMLGQQFNDYFYIANMIFDPRSWVLFDGFSLIWHSISPIFLHFSIEHLIFNTLMFWFLASRLELKLGRIVLLVIVISIALISNYSQLFMSGPLFGGLSGVVYGLLAFVFSYQKKYENLGVNNGIFYFSVVWLLIGMSEIFALMGLFNLANTAHLSGLLSGFFLFAIYSQFNKRTKL